MNDFESELGILDWEEMQASEAPRAPSMAKSNLSQLAGGVTASEEGRRNLFRGLSRAGETIAGLPGDIKSMLQTFAIAIPESIAGEELPRWRGAVLGRDPTAVGAGMPTSREIQEFSEEATGGLTKAQGQWEQLGDEVVSDMTALVTGKVPFARAIGTSILANAGAEVAKDFGGDKASAATKMGLLMVGSLVGQKGGTKRYINELYRKMDDSIPEGASINASKLMRAVESVESQLKKGDPKDLSKQLPLQKIAAIKSKVQGGEIGVEEVIELTKSLNEPIFTRELKRSENFMYPLRKALHDAAGDYGKVNPQFMQSWKTANEAYAATAMSRKLKNWMSRNIDPSKYAYAAGALGAGALAAPGTAATTALGAGAAGTVAFTAEIMNRIAKSPALRRHYSNVLKNGLKENSPAFSRAMGQLDRGLQKSFEEDEWEYEMFSD